MATRVYYVVEAMTSKAYHARHAAAYDELADRLRNAESMTEVPELLELYQTARTSSRSHRQGRYMQILRVADDGEIRQVGNVQWLQNGSHYNLFKNELAVHCRPKPFMFVSEFARKADFISAAATWHRKRITVIEQKEERRRLAQERREQGAER